MEALDRKFIINAKHSTKGTDHTQFDSILFLAKDDFIVPTLEHYLYLCVQNGAGVPQIQSVNLLIDRVRKWRRENPDLCKIPDVDEGEEISVVCRPNLA